MKDDAHSLFDIGIALAALGFVSTVSQVMLMRELVATFYGNELLFGLALMAWLVWGAVGAWGIGGRLTQQKRISLFAFAAGIGAIAPLLVAQMALLRGIRNILGVIPGAYIDFGSTVLTVLLIPMLFCPLAGLLFTLGARLILEARGTAGHAYFAESCGAVIGGLLVSFVFIHIFSVFQVVLSLGVLALICALYLVWDGQRHTKLLLLPFLAATLGMAVAGGAVLDRWTLSWQWRDIVSYAESPYGRLIVQARDGQRVFYTNGLLSFETQSTFPEEVAHFPLLAHPHPRHVLLIGGGVAGDLRELLKHPIQQLTYVELDPQVITMARTHLPPAEAEILADPRVRVMLSDGRHYVANAPQHTFDVIILDLPPPTTGSLNRFYTREFFAQVRQALRPDGLFTLGLPSAENYWNPELTRRNVSIYETLRTAFPILMALTSGDHLFFLATLGSFPIDAATMSERLIARAIETRYVTPSYIEYVFSNDRFTADQQRLTSGGRAVRINEDLVPICYYYDLALWLSRFYPAVGELFERAGLINLAWLSLPWALIVLLTRYRRRWSVPVAIAGVGLAHMMLQVVILIAFQTEHGTVYSGVSMMVTAFMAGLAAGSAWGNWLARRWQGQSAARTEDPIPPGAPSRLARVGLMGIQGSVIGLSGLVVGLLWLPYEIPAVVFGMLAAAAGCITGAAFPLAVLALGEHTASAAGWLYGADLVGGALGAGLGTTLLLPLLGIPQVCAFTALIGVAGLLCLL